jgi:hypothetical protein
MTVHRWLLALAIAIPAAATAAEPRVPVALAPISVEGLHECEVADLEKALRRGLVRAKRFHLVGGLDEAPARMEIVECTRLERHKQTATSKGGPIHGPTGCGPTGHVGIASGSESDVALQTESLRSVILRARVVAGSRFIDVASGPKDRTLREAVETLRRAIDRAIADRGQWLLVPRP